MHDRWNGFEGDGSSTTDPTTRSRTPVFSLRRRSMFRPSGEVEVFAGDQYYPWAPRYLIQGCFSRRQCKILCCRTGEVAAEIARKKAGNRASLVLGDDVFSLAVRPGFDAGLMMAFVVILDRMSTRPVAATLMCS